MRLRTLIGLMICNLIWALNPAATKVLLRSFDPQIVAWLRYSSCIVAYLVFACMARWMPRREPWSRLRFDHSLIPLGRGRQRRRDLWLLLLGGVLTFCVSPILQTTGLNASRATDNAMITALEPLVTLLLARIFLGEKLSSSLALSFVGALVGFAMLSGIHSIASIRNAGVDSHLFGNLLILTSLIGEGSYSVYGRKLMARHPAHEIFGSAVAVGVVILTLGIVGISGPQTLMQLFSFEAWDCGGFLALLWIGPVGTAFTYLYWMIALESLSVGSLALTLFVQPLAGAAFGAFFLGEYLSGVQWLGGGLILASVLGQAWAQGQIRR